VVFLNPTEIPKVLTANAKRSRQFLFVSCNRLAAYHYTIYYNSVDSQKITENLREIAQLPAANDHERSKQPFSAHRSRYLYNIAISMMCIHIS
jgi:hypothetical protein